MVLLKDCSFLVMGLHILLGQIYFGYFLMVAARIIVLAIFVPFSSL
jgi:hypothetical protein